LSIQSLATKTSAVQDVGGKPDERLSDRIRAAEIRIASKDRVLIAVVADESGVGGGEAAAQVVGQVFQMVQASKPGDLEDALRRGLEIADERLRKSGGSVPNRGLVAATAVVVWKRRLFIAHVGDTLALHVSGGKGAPLTQANGSRLGSESPPQITTGRLQIQRGDRIVLASDGLMRRNPETGGPFVSREEIAEHVEQLPPNEAARHLMSLALGRDVDDNVSVAVLALRARAPSERPFPWVAAVGGLLLIVLLAAAALLLRQPGVPPTSDYGFAVLVDGGVLADQGSGTPELVPSLGTIRSASFLTASTDAKLGLQSTFAGGSAVSEANLYLAQSTGVELTAIDPRPAADTPPGDSASHGSDLTLVSGRLLVLRETGTWEFHVHSHGFTASLLGAGRGAIGVEADPDGVSLYCLVGTCGFDGEGGERLLLKADEGISGQDSSSTHTTPLGAGERAQWANLCEGCLE